jgi:hypothetical protein
MVEDLVKVLRTCEVVQYPCEVFVMQSSSVEEWCVHG